MATRRYSRKPSAERNIAVERIEKLFSQAESQFGSSRSLSNRYVALARRIAMKYKIRISPQLRRRFCRHCYSYLKPGINLRVRMSPGHVTYYCLDCKKFMRFPHIREKAKKRATTHK